MHRVRIYTLIKYMHGYFCVLAVCYAHTLLRIHVHSGSSSHTLLHIHVHSGSSLAMCHVGELAGARQACRRSAGARQALGGRPAGARRDPHLIYLYIYINSLVFRYIYIIYSHTIYYTTVKSDSN